jgi:hypothetical protein
MNFEIETSEVIALVLIVFMIAYMCVIYIKKILDDEFDNDDWNPECYSKWDIKSEGSRNCHYCDVMFTCIKQTNINNIHIK